MQILKTKTTRWLLVYESTFRQRVLNLFYNSNLRFDIDIDSEYVYDSELDTKYIAVVFFFRYSQYAVMVLTSELDINEQCFVFKLPKSVPGEGDGWYCREQFEKMIADEMTDGLLYGKSTLENSVIHLIHLECLKEMSNLAEDQ